MPEHQLFAVPIELRQLKQWCLWKYVKLEGKDKPTKVPYQTNGNKCSTTDPSTWNIFEECINIFMHGSYDGLGFVFTNTPYSGIDLDDPNGDIEAVTRQIKIFNEFDSYSEKSPSGKGLHVIVKGNVPSGLKKAFIELYSTGRYFTMTGNVYTNKPIADRHDLLNQLWHQMGGDKNDATSVTIDQPSIISDQQIINLALAHNTNIFEPLNNGNWKSKYPSQSEADQAYMNVIAYYTDSREQCIRIFRASQLGKTLSRKPDQKYYVNKTIKKAFDQKLPPIDFQNYKANIEEQLALPLAGSSNGKTTDFDSDNTVSITVPAANNSDVSPSGLRPAAHNSVTVGSNPTTSTIIPPPGLTGDIAQFIYQAAPRPVPEIAIAAAIGLMAGICGRAYNVSGTGLNQYVLLLADTGTGKEAMASGIDKLINAVQFSVPVANEFVGPSEIQSGQALIKNLAENQSYVSILGEFGLRLRAMSSDKANGAEIALRRMLLDLYNKSGFGQTVRPTIYSDKAKNVAAISAPSFSILGESTPDRFYDVLTEEMISEGLLPRFMMIEYNGPRPSRNENAEYVQPTLMLVEQVAQLMANAKTVMANRKVINVGYTPEAEKMLADLDKYADKQINSTEREIKRQLWNRAHIKALKISALIAVGCNMVNPVITVEHVMWAKSIVERDIKNMSSKFEKGTIGKNSEEVKQINDMKRMIKYFVTQPYDKVKSNCKDERLYNAKIIPYSFLTSRLYSMASFRNDRNGQNTSIKKTIQVLIDSDYIREASRKEMIDMFGTTQKAYIVSRVSILSEDD